MRFFILIICFFLAGCSVSGKPKTSKSDSSNADVFSISLKTIDGRQFSSKDFLGKKALFVSFWASYCDPCKGELLKLKEVYSKYSQHVEMAAVSIDSEEGISLVKQFSVENSIPFPVLIDPENRVVSSIIPGGDTVPYSILVDKDGRIISTHTGYEPGDEIALFKEFDQLIK